MGTGTVMAGMCANVVPGFMAQALDSSPGIAHPLLWGCVTQALDALA